jgi:hypothetical protein
MTTPPAGAGFVGEAAGKRIGDRIKNQRDGQRDAGAGRGHLQHLVVVKQQEYVESGVLDGFSDLPETIGSHGSEPELVIIQYYYPIGLS